MQPTSLIKALHVAADHYGMDVQSNREYLRRQINKLRSAAWKEQASRDAYFKGSGCECVECFNEPCGTRCVPSYSGITFDVNMVGIHRLSINERPIDLAIEPLLNAGCCSTCGCMLYEKMVERFPLKRGIPRGYNNKLIFRSSVTKDNGKHVGVKYVNSTGGIIREDIVLNTEGRGTEWNAHKVLQLTLPERCGWVKVETIDGYELDSYHPSILAPMHMRAKLAGVPTGHLVQWEGYIEPMEAIFDSDLIEFGGDLDLQNGLQLFDLHFKTGRSASEERAFASSLAMFQNSGHSELAAQATVPAGSLRPRSSTQLRNRTKWLMR